MYDLRPGGFPEDRVERLREVRGRLGVREEAPRERQRAPLRRRRVGERRRRCSAFSLSLGVSLRSNSSQPRRRLFSRVGAERVPEVREEPRGAREADAPPAPLVARAESRRRGERRDALRVDEEHRERRVPSRRRPRERGEV